MSVPIFYRNILVVDDEITGVNYIRRVFTSSDGYNVLGVNSIDKVMNNWDRYKDRGTIFIDVFFGDEVLGTTLLRFIKSRSPERFVVMISGRASYRHDYVRFLKMGADSFLEKNFSYTRIKTEYERFWKSSFFLHKAKLDYNFSEILDNFIFSFERRILFFKPLNKEILLTRREADFFNLIFTVKQNLISTSNKAALRSFNISSKSSLVLIVFRLNKKFKKFGIPIIIRSLSGMGYYLTWDRKFLRDRESDLINLLK